jgi:hypothetical protein
MVDGEVVRCAKLGRRVLRLDSRPGMDACEEALRAAEQAWAAHEAASDKKSSRLESRRVQSDETLAVRVGLSADVDPQLACAFLAELERLSSEEMSAAAGLAVHSCKLEGFNQATWTRFVAARAAAGPLSSAAANVQAAKAAKAAAKTSRFQEQALDAARCGRLYVPETRAGLLPSPEVQLARYTQAMAHARAQDERVAAMQAAARAEAERIAAQQLAQAQAHAAMRAIVDRAMALQRAARAEATWAATQELAYANAMQHAARAEAARTATRELAYASAIRHAARSEAAHTAAHTAAIHHAARADAARTAAQMLRPLSAYDGMTHGFERAQQSRPHLRTAERVTFEGKGGSASEGTRWDGGGGTTEAAQHQYGGWRPTPQFTSHPGHVPGYGVVSRQPLNLDSLAL